MIQLSFTKLVATAILTTVIFAGPSLADSVVKVTLTDKGGTMDMSKSMGLGMGMKGDMMKSVMGITINNKSVLHGKVKFNVTNSSTSVIHEMLVAAVADQNVVLPYNATENRVDEEGYKDLGEVSELDPGKSGSLTLDLKPGKYMLFCNVPGHYMAGMWTVLDVR
jgi:uncharacterized cupredoxin-like copper-binding protein